MSLIPLWFILAVATGIFSNVFNFLCRYILRGKDDPTTFFWYSEVAKLVVFLLIARLFDWYLVTTPQAIFLLLLLGLTQLFGGYYWVKMHEHSQLSISTIITRTRMIWVPLLAYFFIGEQLAMLAYIGIAILFIGVSITSAPHKLFVDKGALYANASAVFAALTIILIKVVTDFASAPLIIVFHSLPSVILLPFLMKNPQKRLLQGFRTQKKIKVYAFLSGILMMYMATVALGVGDSSKVNAVYQGMLFLSVLAGIFFLHERDDIPRKLIGMTITIIGVVVLSFT